MCGICACISKKNCLHIVLDGLKKLEYRGYDSAGVAFVANKKLKVTKVVGDIENLKAELKNDNAKTIIGHTRWATHGEVSAQNAHPHISQSGNFSFVHNGIIENYQEIKNQLKITDWKSSTDSEVFLNLIEKTSGNSLIEKIVLASKKIKGTFAFALLSKDGELIVGKRESPLYISKIKDGFFASSDLYATPDSAKFYYTLLDNEFAVLSLRGVEFYNENLEKISKNKEKLGKIEKIADIFESSHMKSEILESKSVLLKTAKFYDFDYFKKINIPKDIKKIYLIACGTAYHSCLLGAEYFKQIGVQSYAYVASEFRYGNEILSSDTLYVFVSQSGETADTIACAKMIKEKGFPMLAITNTPNSFLNRICQNVLPTFAGKEIAVASTKAYVAQVFTLYIFSLYLAGKDFDEIKDYAKNFDIVDFDDKFIGLALTFKKIIFMGRGLDYITALEASLKLKEITYINSLAISSGELKHGTLALVDQDTLVIGILSQSKTKEKFLSNIEEVKARGGKILLVGNLKDTNCDGINIDIKNERLAPIDTVLPLQIFALKMCEKLGYNPDKPRNLAKSVTVE